MSNRSGCASYSLGTSPFGNQDLTVAEFTCREMR